MCCPLVLNYWPSISFHKFNRSQNNGTFLLSASEQFPKQIPVLLTGWTSSPVRLFICPPLWVFWGLSLKVGKVAGVDEPLLLGTVLSFFPFFFSFSSLTSSVHSASISPRHVCSSAGEMSRRVLVFPCSLAVLGVQHSSWLIALNVRTPPKQFRCEV